VALVTPAVIATSGCSPFGGGVFTCDEDADCQAGAMAGTCQLASGFCSFPDDACASGQSYGELSGDLAGTCVGEEPFDARIDSDPAAPDASTIDACSACGTYRLAAAADGYLRQQFPTENHGADPDYHRCGSGDPADCCTNRVVVRFDLSPVPPGCNVVSANLGFYYFEQHYTDRSPTFGAHRMTIDWEEATATWNERTSGNDWATAGGDFDPAPVANVVAAAGVYGWLVWNIAPLASAWLAGTQPNFGVIIVEPNDLNGADRGRKLLRTREYPTATEQPYLEITCAP
jgi:hypothetical protein